MRGVVNVLGVWLKVLRTRFARDQPSTSLLQILDTPLGLVLYRLFNLHVMNDLYILGGGALAVKWAGMGTPPSATSKDADSYGTHKLLVFHAYGWKKHAKNHH